MQCRQNVQIYQESLLIFMNLRTLSYHFVAFEVPATSFHLEPPYRQFLTETFGLRLCSC